MFCTQGLSDYHNGWATSYENSRLGWTMVSPLRAKSPMASHSSLGLDEETFFLAEIPPWCNGKTHHDIKPPTPKKISYRVKLYVLFHPHYQFGWLNTHPRISCGHLPRHCLRPKGGSQLFQLGHWEATLALAANLNPASRDRFNLFRPWEQAIYPLVI